MRVTHFDAKNYSLNEIIKVIARLLKKLQDGIRLGALTTKDFGLVVIENLDACIYDFRKKSDVAAWLLDKTSPHKISPSTEKNLVSSKDFIVEANFKFKSSFIVRDYDVSVVTMKIKGFGNLYKALLSPLLEE